jgi:hypothetical protein
LARSAPVVTTWMLPAPAAPRVAVGLKSPGFTRPTSKVRALWLIETSKVEA